MNRVFGIDTSHYVAVGLAVDGQPIERLVVRDTRAHLESLMPQVEALVSGAGITLAQIDAYAVGMGPGPFTGLRVGIATAETLAFASGRPLHRVCSLDVIAAQVDSGPREFVVASDARRKELYWAHYVDGRRQGEPRVGPPSELPELPVVGAVPEAYRSQLTMLDADLGLDPALLAALAADLPSAPGEPYYLRPADATVGGPPKSTLPRLRARR